MDHKITSSFLTLVLVLELKDPPIPENSGKLTYFTFLSQTFCVHMLSHLPQNIKRR